MKARFVSLLVSFSAVTLLGCPGTTPLDCARKCAGEVAPPSVCVDGLTRRTFELSGHCADACSFVALDAPCATGCRDGQCADGATGGGTGTGGGAATGGGGGGTTGGGSGGGSGGGAGTGGGMTNPCDGVSCNTPPASACADAQTLRISEPTGTCSQGACSYATHDEACDHGCVDGACAGNPCQGVTCSAPPASVCLDGTTLKVFNASGTCSQGACSYAASQATCQFGCASGACVNDPCAGKTCSQPPAAFCLDVSTLRSFGTAGVCSGGSCLYTPADTTCQFGCSNGACAHDPCAGKSCTQPPAPACITSTTLRTFGTAGVCSGGSCLYTPADTTCQYGCTNGACAGNPCQGISCTTPPASTCADPQTLKTWQTPGACSGGACGYQSQLITCQYGCANGACANDPCQGVTCSQPPANTCADTQTLRTFTSPGTCAGGGCSYAPRLVTCQFGCASGACNNDPCAGVTCATPPAKACLDATHLRTFNASGACSAGSCTYAAIDSTCQYGCSNGGCNNDPCQGVTCSAPPAKTCVGSAVRTYSGAGSCSSGTCGYAYTDTPCPNGCGNGACKAPTCGSTTCDTPPSSTCTTANHLTTYFPQGSCSGTTCSYTGIEVECSQGCLNGACISGSWTLESSPFGTPLTATRVIFDAAGQPLITGCDASGDVLLRRRTASGWREETVDTGMGAYCQSAVSLDAAGEPMVAWYDSVNGDLRFALRNNGTWAPKELIANQDNVGSGVSMVTLPDGRPAVAYAHSTSTTGETRYAVRTSGTWADELLTTGANTTELVLLDGAVWVSLSAPAVAVRGASGGWAVTPVEPGTAYTSTTLAPHSLMLEHGVPSLLVTRTNPLRSSTQSAWRTLNASWSEVVLNDKPVAVRTEAPQAVLIAQGSSPVTGLIRVRRNEAWVDAVTSVPYFNWLSTIAAYTGTGGQHVIYDQYGRKLTSPAVCTPQCSTRACGDDGCGGSCGACSSGTCAPDGSCSAWKETTLTGYTPVAAALGSGTGLHLATTSGAIVRYRSNTGSGWSAPSDVPGSSSLLSAVIPVDTSDAPLVCTSQSAVSNYAVNRLAGGTWAVPATAVAGTFFDVDQAGTWYLARATSSQIYLRKATGGVWGSEVSVYTKPSSYDSVSLLAMAVSASGRVTMLISTPYWVSGSNPGYSYAWGLWTFESGAWAVSNLGWPSTLSSASAKLHYDGAETLHLATSQGYFTRAPGGGAVTAEAWPAGLTAASTFMPLNDRNGVHHFVYLRGSGATRELALAQRTGAGTWAIDTAPLLLGQHPWGTSAWLTATFDASNVPHVVLDDASTWRELTK
jgi:hypothetical protein